MKKYYFIITALVYLLSGVNAQDEPLQVGSALEQLRMNYAIMHKAEYTDDEKAVEAAKRTLNLIFKFSQDGSQFVNYNYLLLDRFLWWEQFDPSDISDEEQEYFKTQNWKAEKFNRNIPIKYWGLRRITVEEQNAGILPFMAQVLKMSYQFLDTDYLTKFLQDAYEKRSYLYLRSYTSAEPQELRVEHVLDLEEGPDESEDDFVIARKPVSQDNDDSKSVLDISDSSDFEEVDDLSDEVIVVEERLSSDESSEDDVPAAAMQPELTDRLGLEKKHFQIAASILKLSVDKQDKIPGALTEAMDKLAGGREYVSYASELLKDPRGGDYRDFALDEYEWYQHQIDDYNKIMQKQQSKKPLKETLEIILGENKALNNLQLSALREYQKRAKMLNLKPSVTFEIPSMLHDQDDFMRPYMLETEHKKPDKSAMEALRHIANYKPRKGFKRFLNAIGEINSKANITFSSLKPFLGGNLKTLQATFVEKSLSKIDLSKLSGVTDLDVALPDGTLEGELSFMQLRNLSTLRLAAKQVHTGFRITGLPKGKISKLSLNIDKPMKDGKGKSAFFKALVEACNAAGATSILITMPGIRDYFGAVTSTREGGVETLRYPQYGGYTVLSYGSNPNNVSLQKVGSLYG